VIRSRPGKRSPGPSKTVGSPLMRPPAGCPSRAEHEGALVNNGPVIVTTDLSARSDRSVDRGLRLAAQLDAPAQVVHVINRSDARFAMKRSATRLFLEEFGPLPDGVDFVAEVGDPPSVIARIAEVRASPLVVMGASQLNEALDFVLGTTVERLIGGCPVPILVVKRRSSRPYERLLIASDFSDCSRDALQTAAMMFPAAALRVVHVYRAPFQGFLERESTIDFIRSEAEKELEAFVSQLSVPLRARVEAGLEEGDSISGKIADVSRDWGADLIVVGSHGRSGLTHALIGSRAVDILNCVPSDTLVVR
jgi:nucleotide-binding universal stress UspA family protein